jgi:hypothetical protein
LDHNVRDILRCDDLSGKDTAGRRESNRFAWPALAFRRMNIALRSEDWQLFLAASAIHNASPARL